MTTGPGGKISRLISSASYRWHVSITVVIFLIALSSSLPVSNEQKPSRPDKSLLNGAVSELDDALLRLRKYAQSLKSGAELANEAGDEDPVAESHERETEEEDPRQEPELVPGLDRFDKNVEENNEEVRGRNQHLAAKSADKDDTRDISLQDLVNFLREHSKDKKTEGDINRLIELEGKKTTTKSTLAPHGLSHLEVNDLIEFLKERQKQKPRDRSDDRMPTNSPDRHPAIDVGRTEADDDSNDPSLTEALAYLASLKKKLSSKP